MSGLDEQNEEVPTCKYCGEAFRYWTIGIWDEDLEEFESVAFINSEKEIDMEGANTLLEIESYKGHLIMDEVLFGNAIICGICDGVPEEEDCKIINELIREHWHRRICL